MLARAVLALLTETLIVETSHSLFAYQYGNLPDDQFVNWIIYFFKFRALKIQLNGCSHIKATNVSIRVE